ncbi:hypothetical protein D3C75_1100610 [compost metagenome]
MGHPDHQADSAILRRLQKPVGWPLLQQVVDHLHHGHALAVLERPQPFVMPADVRAQRRAVCPDFPFFL